VRRRRGGAALQGAVAGAEGELQVLAQALATVEVPVQRMRARVEPLMDAEPLAAAREARNDEVGSAVPERRGAADD
jgi:hypothetical protein